MKPMGMKGKVIVTAIDIDMTEVSASGRHLARQTSNDSG